MPNLAIAGKHEHVTWAPTFDPTGTAVTTTTPIVLSDYGRNFVLNDNFTTNDITTYSEALANSRRSHLGSLGDATATMEIMYQTGTAGLTLYNSLAPGTTGVIVVEREGVGTTLPIETFTGIVTKRDRTAPYDNVAMLSIGFQVTGAIVATAQA